MTDKNYNIDVEINSSIISDKLISTILVAVTEYILYSRNQIPFNANTFRIFVNKFRDLSSKQTDWNQFLIEKQRQLAIKTVESIDYLSQDIKNLIKNKHVKSACLLFGSTEFTPKESFIIKLPKYVPHEESHDNDDTIDNIVKSVLISLTTCQNFQKITSPILKLTNIFFMVKARNDNIFQNKMQNKEMETYLSKNSKIVTIRLKTNSAYNNDSDIHSKKIVIFDDFQNLNIKDTDDDEEAIQNMLINDDKYSWNTSNIVIKGFKDNLIKGNSIWNI